MTRKELTTMIAVSLGSFMVTLDISIVNVALPSIQHELNSSMTDLQWIVDAYALTLSALILSSGIMSDRFGKKLIWNIGVSIFTLGSIICALSPNNIWLITGRITQGIGGAALIPGAMAIIMMTFSDHHIRNKMVGIWSSSTAIALIIGPMMGGVLVNYFGWSTIFSINIPIGLLIIVLSAYAIQPEPKNHTISLDPIGQLLTMIMLGTLTFGLIELSQSPSLSFLITVFTVSFITFVLFILWERKITAPLVPLSLFQSWEFSRDNIAAFVIGFATYSNIFFLSLFFQNAQGYSAIETGFRLVPEFIAMGIFAISYGKIAKMFKTQTLLLVAFGLIVASSLMMAQFTSQSSYTFIAISMFLMGIGMGISIPAVSLLTLKDAPKDKIGSVSSIMNAFRQTGMAISIALLGAIMTSNAAKALKTELLAIPNHENIINDAISQGLISADISLIQVQSAWAHGFNIAMLGAAISAMIVIVCLLIKSKKR
ncbi:MAG: MFS transporter [Wohlfahrtiimonas sp.]